MFHLKYIANSNNVKISNTLRRIFGIFLTVATGLAVTSCNEKSDDTEIYLTPSNVAVTSFVLNANDDVMEDLDSVFFSIDLKNGVIFNADSLPLGTKVNKLVATIKYSSYITKATIKMEGGSTRTGEINYLESPTDSIDFTGKVSLMLSTDNDAVSREYLIKLNVHKEKSDSLVWAERERTALPSRMDSPKNQKSISFNGTIVSLIEENDGTYTYASSSDIYAKDWQKTAVTFPFTPDVRSLCATTASLIILDTNGVMYESTDGLTWSATGETWSAMLGAYLDTAIGIRSEGGAQVYAQYPMKNLNISVIDPEFPISGFSNFEILANKWTSSPVGFFVGGICSDGSLSNATWAFDGYNWIKLSEGGVPHLRGTSLIPYYGFRFTASTWYQTEYPVWMVVGGTESNGAQNKVVYISYDNGVSWNKGSESLQLPKEIPAMTGCDCLVANHRKSANLSAAWSKETRSHNIEVDGDIIYWDCPYIYMIGGFNPQGQLYNTIWQGVLARLAFTPVI